MAARALRGAGFCLVAWQCFLPGPGAGMGEEPVGRSLSDVTRAVEGDLGEFERSDLRCGVESLYLLGRLLEFDCTLDEVERLVPVGERGTSLGEIQRAAAQLGIRLDGVVCAPEAMGDLPLPAIALMEPPVGSTYHHFVVLCEVSSDAVTVADPVDGRLREVPRDLYGRTTTGYYLVRRTDRYGLGLTVAWGVLGLLLLAWCSGRWVVPLVKKGSAGFLRRDPSRSWPERDVQGLAGMWRLLLVAVAIGLSGCSGKGRPEGGDTVSSSAVAPVLEVKRTRQDLGLLEGQDEFEGTFIFRNIGAQPVRFTLGEPSCQCLGVEVHPENELAPGEEGRIVLALSTRGRIAGGSLTGHVLLKVEGSKESYSFSLSGFLEGIAARAPFVVRPSHLRRKKIPPLTFDISTLEEDVGFKLLSISCQKKHYPGSGEEPLPNAQGPITRGAPSDQVTALVDQAVVGDIRYNGKAAGYSRRVEVPIEASLVEESVSGDFVIAYELRGRERLALVDLLLLADGEMFP